MSVRLQERLAYASWSYYQPCVCLYGVRRHLTHIGPVAIQPKAKTVNSKERNHPIMVEVSYSTLNALDRLLETASVACWQSQLGLVNGLVTGLERLSERGALLASPTQQRLVSKVVKAAFRGLDLTVGHIQDPGRHNTVSTEAVSSLDRSLKAIVYNFGLTGHDSTDFLRYCCAAAARRLVLIQTVTTVTPCFPTPCWTLTASLVVAVRLLSEEWQHVCTICGFWSLFLCAPTSVTYQSVSLSPITVTHG